MRAAIRQAALKPRQTALARAILQSSPFFQDLFNSLDGTMTGRTGWTRDGDATKGDKMVVLNGIARMNTGSNGDAPFGFQKTPDPGVMNRRITFGYDFSQSVGGTKSNSATPYQWHDQQMIVAWQDINNYSYISPAFFSGGLVEFRLYKVISGAATEMFRWEFLPTAGVMELTLTDRVRCIVNDVIRLPTMLYNDARNVHPDRLWTTTTTNSIRTGPAALRHTFYPLVLALDYKVETLDITVADPKPFYGRDANNQRSITFSGTYNGTPVSWCYRLRRRSTGVTVKDWTAFTPTANAGAWSAALTINSGGPYFADFGWTGADGFTRVVTAAPFAVGILICAYGQSHAVSLSGITGSPGFGGNDLIHGFNAYAQYVGTQVRRWMGDLTPQERAYNPNMTGLAKALTDALVAAGDNTPVGVAACGVASTALADLKPGTTYWNNVLVPFVTEIGGNVEHWLWVQGEAEGLSLSDYSNYTTDFASLVTGLRSQGGRSNAKVFVRIFGKDTAVSNTGASITRSQAMRSILKGLANGVDIFTSASMLGIPLIGGGDSHNTPAGAYSVSYREGLSVAKGAYGALAYDGRGPIITSASRSGAVITCAVDLNGASGISGTGLTGYAVSNDDFATELTISSVDVVANQVVITLAGVPSGTVKIRSYREPNYNDATLALGTYLNGVTIPVLNVIDPISVT